jgi:uncharacterized Zn finger protein
MAKTNTPSALVQNKAVSYLSEGRVRVIFADPTRYAGTVQGTFPYLVTSMPGADWYCTCPATATCAHIVASQKIWTREEAR